MKIKILLIVPIQIELLSEAIEKTRLSNRSELRSESPVKWINESVTGSYLLILLLAEIQRAP